MPPEKRSKKKRVRPLPPWVGVLLTALLAGVLALFFGGTQSYFVPSQSMVPTLLKGDQFRADTLIAPRQSPKRGEIWVLRNPTPDDGNGAVLVKRVIGLPGEKVEVAGGLIRINGEPLAETYVKEPAHYKGEPVKLKEDQFWVLGDNRNQSADSHLWGPVPRGLFIGRAFFQYWPLDRMRWL